MCGFGDRGWRIVRESSQNRKVLERAVVHRRTLERLAQTMVRYRIIWIDFQRGSEMRNRLVISPREVEDASEIGVGNRRERLDFERVTDLHCRVPPPMHVRQRHGVPMSR